MSFLGIDIGSTRIKAALISESGGVAEFVSREISGLIKQPHPLHSERDVIEVWKSLCSLLRTVKRIETVTAVCVDATSSTIVPIGEEHEPLHAALMYNDQRAQEEVNEILSRSAAAREFQEILPIDASLALPKCLWLLKNSRISKEIYKFLHENDYFTMKLCNRIVTSPNIASKTHINPKTLDYHNEILEEIGFNLDYLPQVAPTGEVVGYVTAEASRETGIPEGTPVVNGVTDSSAGDIATGTVEPGEVNINIGTSLVVHGVVDGIVPDEKGRIYYKPYLGENYIVGGATNAGTLPLDAFCSLVGKSFEELEREAEKAPTGCEGLVAQPEWMGTRIPDHNPRVRGFFIGITRRNLTQGHMFRSLMEGNAITLSRMLEIISELTKQKIRDMTLCGGGARSKLQCQIIADVTGKTVKTVETDEPAIGSAILAMAGLKGISSLRKIAKKIARKKEVYHADQKNHSTLQGVADRLFKLTEAVY
nr:FGGY family carbohydrate kinase [Candidatus Freyarchaeota archaeon]